jgi:hypothetical protein
VRWAGQRVLVCDTEEGKVHMARHLEPMLHVDGTLRRRPCPMHPTHAEEHTAEVAAATVLAKHVPRVVLVVGPDAPASAQTPPRNVLRVPALTAAALTRRS